MFTAAVQKVNLALFPVFLSKPLQDGRTQIAVSGAAFFIDAHGTFLTCAHLVPRDLGGAVLEYRGRAPDSAHNPTLPMHELYRDDSKDIYIGHIDLDPPGYLQLADATPDVGRSVCICGYPMPKLSTGKGGALEVGGIRRYIQPTFVLDRMRMQDSKRSLDFDAIVLRDFGLYGMSGGPVVDVNATVIGMQSQVTNPRVSEGPDGSKLVVQNAIAVSTDELRNAFDRVSQQAAPQRDTG